LLFEHVKKNEHPGGFLVSMVCFESMNIFHFVNVFLNL
jgi:hypothetical protein